MDLRSAPPSAALAAFADEIGDAGPVTVVGGRTHWTVGGALDPAAREVHAPVGIVVHEPAELIVRCGAGTPVSDLAAAVGEHGQMSPLDAPDPRSTVGGVLATGFSGVRRLRYGPVRDLLLEARYVAADGRLVKAGAPVVKNVTGFDLCRLLVGSLGTIGFIGEVVLRCRPIPAASGWFVADGADPWAVRKVVSAPSSLLWDGTRVWLLLEGHSADVADGLRSARTRGSFEQCAGPPVLPVGARLSVEPSKLRALDTRDLGQFVAEVGVGTVHAERTPEALRPTAPSNAELHERVRAAYDPARRLNPGRWWW